MARVTSYAFFERTLAETSLFRFTTSRLTVEPHQGAFSVKLVRNGRELYRFGSRRVWLKPAEYLLVNEGETYGSEVTSRTESLSVFYTADDLRQAVGSMAAGYLRLLEGPRTQAQPEVAQIPLATTPALRAIQDALLAALRADDPNGVDECAQQLLAAALAHSLGLVPPGRLSAVRRRSTRDELLARVFRARDFIHDSRGRDCRLQRLAEVACLSKFHLLRVFRDAFGATPAVYARRVRLVAAVQALRAGARGDVAARGAGYADRRSLRRALRGAQFRNPGHPPRC